MPYALSIGIDYQTFWKLNPAKLEAFIKAHKLRQEQVDYEAWLYGQYTYIAINTVMANFSAGMAGKSADAKYIEKPFTLLEEERKKEAEDLNNPEVQRQRAIDLLNALAIRNGKEKMESEVAP